MSEPSKEARERAARVCRDETLIPAVAAALQELIDETDDLRQQVANAMTDEVRADIRREKAEAKLAALLDELRPFYREPWLQRFIAKYEGKP